MSTSVAWDVLVPIRDRARRGLATAAGLWAPLKNPTFQALLLGSLLGSVGARVGELTTVWLMTELTKSPLKVSLVMTAYSIPGFLLALPAGAIADVRDRRRLLLGAQAMISINMALLSFLTGRGWMNPIVLLAIAFVAGLFSTITSPTSDALLPQIVGRKDLSPAIALNGVRYQISRAIGPMIGGVLISSLTITHTFLVCAAVPFGTMLFLSTWRAKTRTSSLPAERVTAALRAGVRYVRYTPALIAVMIRTFAFIAAGSAMWALLPTYARHHLGLDAYSYGMLFGCFGLGGVIGGMGAYAFVGMSSQETVMSASTVIFAITLLTIPRVEGTAALAAILFVGGIAWSAGMVELKTAVQTAAPDWVRARISSIYLLTLHGAVAIGSAVWGLVASYDLTPRTLQYAAVVMTASLLTALRYRLRSVPEPREDLLPPPILVELPPGFAQEGVPLMVTLEYQIDPERTNEFEQLMQEISSIRRRVGAVFWGLFLDASGPGRYVEHFLVDSALDALRMHERMTGAERQVFHRAHSLHMNGAAPAPRHHLSVHGIRCG